MLVIAITVSGKYNTDLSIAYVGGVQAYFKWNGDLCKLQSEVEVESCIGK